MNTKLLSALGAAAFVATTATSADAFSFNNNAVLFDTDTTVEFTFLGGDGAFVRKGILDFGVADSSGTQLATLFDSFKPTDAPKTASYKFIGGQTYTLFLEREETIDLYSTTALNWRKLVQVKFDGGDIFAEGSLLSWEDLRPGDADYNDYYVKATAEAVPTPAAVLPILGGLFGFASKRKREEEEA